VVPSAAEGDQQQPRNRHTGQGEDLVKIGQLCPNYLMTKLCVEKLFGEKVHIYAILPNNY
jgi:hypothetical protein